MWGTLCQTSSSWPSDRGRDNSRRRFPSSITEQIEHVRDVARPRVHRLSVHAGIFEIRSDVVNAAQIKAPRERCENGP